MSPCRFVVRITPSNHHVYCCAPGKKAGGSVRCFDHWPKVVS